MKVLDKGRLHIAAVAIGASKRMPRDAPDYAMNRKQFGSPISDFQLVQGMLADCKTELYPAECMVIDAARKRHEGRAVTIPASCESYSSTKNSGRAAPHTGQPQDRTTE